MADEKSNLEVPIFSFTRFGPGSISLLILIAFATYLLYSLGFPYLAAVSAAAAVFLFGVKSLERQQLIFPEPRAIVGAECVAVKGIETGKPGVVRIRRADGSYEPEFWSAESEHPIPVGEHAKIIQIRSVVLIIEPTESQAS
jgi:membrane protein implicated in regulation of membrane protease activity